MNMRDKIVQALKQKYSNLGVSDKAFDGVADFIAKTITEEGKIEDAVGGAEAFLKAYQSDVDKERGTSAKLRKELEEYKKPAPKDERKKDEPKEDNVTPEYKALTEQLASVQQTLAKLTGEKTHETKLQQLNSILSEKKIPSTFATAVLNGRSFNEETNVDELATTIEDSYTAFLKENANDRFKDTLPPEQSEGGKDDPMASIVAEIEKGTKEIIQKQN